MPSGAVANPARSFLTLFVRDEGFALPVESIREVIRLPELAPVPRSPASLAGLANLRGAVLPVADLRRLLRREAPAPGGEARVLVVGGDAPFGLLVDRVGRLLDAEPEALAPGGESEADPADTDVVEGMIRGGEGQAALPVLAPARLLRRDFARGGRPAAREGAAPIAPVSVAQAGEAAPGEADQVLVSFAAAGQEYALPAAVIEEIAPAPERLPPVMPAEAGLLGVIARRGRLLPLLSLRALLGMPPQAAGKRAKIVVVRLGEAGAVGLVVDRQGEVLRLPAALVDPVPPLLARRRPGLEVAAICRLEGGRRLVPVLSPAQLFRLDGLRAAGTQPDPEENEVPGSEATEAGAEQFVVFRLDEEEFGVPIADVEEVLRLPDLLTPVPNAPEVIEGVINLRGAVLPVVDQRRRFGLPARPRTGRERILVCQAGGTRAGFIVDSVAEVLRAPPAAIGPAPDLARDEPAPLVTRVVNLEARGRLVLVLDTARLLGREAAGALAAGQPAGDV